MGESDNYILDLARLYIEVEDKELVRKNLMACTYALCYFEGLSPGYMLGEVSSEMPSEDEWFEEYLPTMMDPPEDYIHAVERDE